ncbi:MAG: lamin tail domain-containing protein, partial [Patescibacteria group bacterium]
MRKFCLGCALLCVSMTPVFAATVGHVVISQIATDEGGSNEFIQIFNPSAVPVDLTNWQLKKVTSSGSDSTYLDSKIEGTIPAYGFYYFAPSASSFAAAADEVYSADSNRITN